jgi:hypothetical protein
VRVSTGQLLFIFENDVDISTVAYTSNAYKSKCRFLLKVPCLSQKIFSRQVFTKFRQRNSSKSDAPFAYFSITAILMCVFLQDVRAVRVQYRMRVL